MDPIYLDYNATTPLDPAVAEAMQPYLSTHFGNPSSSHSFGVQARQAVEKARRQVAELLGAQPHEIIFTSGGSEANNLALTGLMAARRAKGNHLLISAVEHPAITEVADYLAEQGCQVSVVPVDGTGRVDPEDVRRALTPATVLVSIMHANNEVGTIQPIREIADLVHAHGAIMHVDAAQSIGKLPVQVDDLGADLLTVVSHKFYGPKGVGALYIRTGVKLARQIHGANHEGGIRAGTENVLEIVGLGQAAELAREQLDRRADHMRRLRDRLHERIVAGVPEVRLNGHPEERLPNTLSLSFPGIEANVILSELEDVAASAGAACHADEVIMSPTLEAMAVPVEYAMGTIRFSTGSMLTEAQVDKAAEAVVQVIQRLRPAGGDVVCTPASQGEIKLTRFTSGLGCACKLRPQALEQVLAALPPVATDECVLVGTETVDDAAVYRVTDDLAVVQTVDFFTPVVDDPYTFGAIAATNSLSDIYAMGAEPKFALSVVGFPSNRLPLSVLEDILRGGRDKAAEAGIAILGGHTVDDPEPKFGLAVTGLVAPDRMWRNVGAQVGDVLFLTKPLGLGIMTTALKAGLLEPAERDQIHEVMTGLNATSARVLRGFEVHACTDVTGFGLLGHLREMTSASKVDAEIDHRSLPILPRAIDLATGGTVPGGTINNRAYVEASIDWADQVAEVSRVLCCDAQTSGGLLAAIPEASASEALRQLHEAGVTEATIVGRCTQVGEGRIRVR
jgi:cysteine desulfurase